MNSENNTQPNGFLFSLGQNIHSGLPKTLIAESLERLASRLMGLTRGAEKEGLFVSFAYSDKAGTRGKRCGKNAQPLPVLFLDVDEATPEQAAALPEKLRSMGADAFTYPSFTDGAPKYEMLKDGKKPAPGQTAKTLQDSVGRVFRNVLHDADGKPIVRAPACPRFRVVLGLSRAPSTQERLTLMRWASHKLGVEFDSTTKDDARVYFTPRIKELLKN